MHEIYLDNHATTRLDPEVFEQMRPWLVDGFGNVSSSHPHGRRAAAAIDDARERIAAAFGAELKDVIFTSGATEANNLALKGALQGSASERHLLVSRAEHRSVLDPARRLAREGVRVTYLPVDATGAVCPEEVRRKVNAATDLVAVMWANNEVGTINLIKAVLDACRETDALLHSDITQAVGAVPIDFRQVPVDSISLSAHKCHGPQGVGVLLANDRMRRRLKPLLEGGRQERGLRAGTVPVSLVAGCAAAVELAVSRMEDCHQISALRDRLQSGLSAEIPDLVINGNPNARLPGNANVSVPGVDGLALLNAIHAAGVMVSNGSACTSSAEPSHVLTAMGIDDRLALASLRFGLSRFTTAEEIEQTIQIVSDRVRELRSKA